MAVQPKTNKADFSIACSIVLSAFVLLLILPAGVTETHSQTTATGSVVGTVSDSSRAIVPNVTVELAQVSTGTKRNAITDNIGVFRFSLLPPGNYAATFSAPGLSVLEMTGITIDVSQVQTLNVTMRVGVQTSTVKVVGNAVQVDQVTPTLGSVLVSPLGGRFGRKKHSSLRLTREPDRRTDWENHRSEALIFHR